MDIPRRINSQLAVENYKLQVILPEVLKLILAHQHCVFGSIIFEPSTGKMIKQRQAVPLSKIGGG